MRRQRRSFTTEFKRESACLVIEQGYTINDASLAVGVGETEWIFNGLYSRKLPNDIQRIAARKLEMLFAVSQLKSLRIPPSNRLAKDISVPQRRISEIAQGKALHYS